MGEKQKARRYERIVRLVNRICNGDGRHDTLSNIDDLASDILLRLFQQKAYQWDDQKIINYIHSSVRYAAIELLSRKTKTASEFGNADVDGNAVFEIMGGSVNASQHTVVLANEAREAVGRLPNKERSALEILMDGGNPLDVAKELEMKPWDAIDLIARARSYVDRV